jgi:hypothetical protein
MIKGALLTFNPFGGWNINEVPRVSGAVGFIDATSNVGEACADWAASPLTDRRLIAADQTKLFMSC